MGEPEKLKYSFWAGKLLPDNENKEEKYAGMTRLQIERAKMLDSGRGITGMMGFIESCFGKKTMGQTGQPTYHWMPDKRLMPYGAEKGAQRPDAAKFAGKWYDGEEPEEIDAIIEFMHKRRYQDTYRLEEYMDKTGFAMDNLYWVEYMKWANVARVPKYGHVHPQPFEPRNAMFHCQCQQQRHDFTKWLDYLHCIGNLGENHPTCRKAQWHMEFSGPDTPHKNFLKEMDELGHFDPVKKWGMKWRASYLPCYQPVKVHLPGNYEWWRSETLLEKNPQDRSGEWSFNMAPPNMLEDVPSNVEEIVPSGRPRHAQLKYAT